VTYPYIFYKITIGRRDIPCLDQMNHLLILLIPPAPCSFYIMLKMRINKSNYKNMERTILF